MKIKTILFALLFSSILSCAQDKTPVQGETEFQRTINSEYKDASQSPLKAKDLKTFKGLDFFKFDSEYVVTATLELTPDTKFSTMKTTTSRLTQKRVFGILTFKLKGKDLKLNVYQDKDLMQREEYTDYLFLPFLDDTNGESSYGGGRYIDLRIPEGNTMVVDFNTAYNPYCAYNDKYSCPIVPRNNALDIAIEAGVKAFDKH
jgi:uncharacterized protein (DUF1684 family)